MGVRGGEWLLVFAAIPRNLFALLPLFAEMRLATRTWLVLARCSSGLIV